MKATSILVLCGAVLLAAAPASAQSERDAARGRLDSALRESTQYQAGSPRRGPSLEGGGMFSGDKLDRVKHGAFSLLLPGWSQYRSGHDKRALFFASAELSIWGGWIFSKLQADYRQDRYVDYAQRFAEVAGSDHEDDYWRAVASYRDSDSFNDAVRRDLRAGADPEAGLVDAADAWSWQSEQRFQEFKSLRADAIAAEDRADFIVVFLLVNRVVAFVDAVRSGPPSEEDLARDGAPGVELGDSGLSLGLGLDPDPGLRAPSLVLGGRF